MLGRDVVDLNAALYGDELTLDGVTTDPNFDSRTLLGGVVGYDHTRSPCRSELEFTSSAGSANDFAGGIGTARWTCSRASQSDSEQTGNSRRSVRAMFPKVKKHSAEMRRNEGNNAFSGRIAAIG